MKLKAKREQIKFDYEFLDGSTKEFIYLAQTTEQVDNTVAIDEKDTAKILQTHKETLRACLRGTEEDIDKMLSELTTDGNMYDFKGELETALGKQKKKK